MLVCGDESGVRGGTYVLKFNVQQKNKKKQYERYKKIRVHTRVFINLIYLKFKGRVVVYCYMYSTDRIHVHIHTPVYIHL